MKNKAVIIILLGLLVGMLFYVTGCASGSSNTSTSPQPASASSTATPSATVTSQPVTTAAVKSTPVTSSTTAVTSTPVPVTTTSSTAPPRPPPGIPHTLDGRADCLTCHTTGVGGADKLPADHAGRTINLCTACHQPGVAPKPPSPGIKRIPHPLDGRADCLACHATGIGGADKIPGDHAGRTNDLCTGCHQPGGAPKPPPPGPPRT